eukprot:3935113-Rhodomonas_salina.2
MSYVHNRHNGVGRWDSASSNPNRSHPMIGFQNSPTDADVCILGCSALLRSEFIAPARPVMVDAANFVSAQHAVIPKHDPLEDLKAFVDHLKLHQSDVSCHALEPEAHV